MQNSCQIKSSANDFVFGVRHCKHESSLCATICWGPISFPRFVPLMDYHDVAPSPSSPNTHTNTQIQPKSVKDPNQPPPSALLWVWRWSEITPCDYKGRMHDLPKKENSAPINCIVLLISTLIKQSTIISVLLVVVACDICDRAS